MWSTARRLFAARASSCLLIRPTRNLGRHHACEGLGSSLRFVHNSPPLFDVPRPEKFLIIPGERSGTESVWTNPLPEEIEAFAQLAKAELVSDAEADPSYFLTLPDEFKLLWEYRTDRVAEIYKRDCYDELVAFITSHLDKERGVVITGTPGIGKTGFLFYLLWCSLKDRRDVVLAVGGWYYVLQWEGKQLRVGLTRSILLVAEAFRDRWRRWPWFLADKVVPEGNRKFAFKFLLTCSPRNSSVGELTKVGGIQAIYVPTWTEEELCKLGRRVFGLQDEEVKRRFSMWGGVPRFVLDEVRLGDQELLTEAISVTAQHDLRKLRFNENLIAIAEELSHKVFHCKPVEGDFTRVRHFPASSFVVEELLKQLPDSVLEGFLHEPVHQQLLDVQSSMWEKYVLSYLEIGGELQVRTSTGMKMISLPGAKGARKVAVLPNAPSDDLADILISSTSRTNVAWDAIRGNMMFQITVSSTRQPLKESSFQMKETFRFMDMVCGAGCKKELIYVVPRSVFPTFTAKHNGQLEVKVATIPAKTPSLSELFQEFFSKVISRRK